ncbi:MAG: 8-oxoguanine deaminase [Gammaproteobacteria bacterium]|nr:8-oxoguanine deaminase [Gammaproteobacteria bacterium]
MRIWLKQPLAISVDGAAGGVVIEGSTIVQLVPAGGEPTTAVDQTLDMSQHVILPGLINTHHHFYQTLTRAVPAALNKELFPWLKSLYPIWAGLDDHMIHVATKLACAELLLSGCTTAADHHYLFPEGVPEALDCQVAGVRDIGIRATLTRGSMSLGEKDGGLPPQSTVQNESVILKDCERAIGQYHQAGDGSMLNIAFAPCSPFSVTEGLMRDSADLARQLGVRLHTHLAETHDETAFCEHRFGCRPVDYLERVGWLADDVWLAHGIHFDDHELCRLGDAGVGISHCPSSNMVLASGICRTKELEANGAIVGIGVDGSASNDGSNMIQEARQALLIQRLRYGSAEVTHHDAIRWVTEGSANCLGRHDIGRIAVGKQADLACFKLDELRFSGAGDPLAALLLCGAHRADRVMVAGQWRVYDGHIEGLDVQALFAEHDAAAKKLLAKVA